MKIAKLALTLALVVITSPLFGQPTRLEKAIEDQMAVTRSRPRDPGAMNDLANLLVLARRHDEAEEQYRSALAVDGSFVPARYNLALLLEERGQSREAEREIDQILQFDPDFAWAHYALGRIIASQGKRRVAVDHYVTAFRLRPELALRERNPDLFNNPLASWALLKFYLEPSVGRSTRSYDDPASVRRTLYPGLADGEEPRSKDAVQTEAPGEEAD